MKVSVEVGVTLKVGDNYYKATTKLEEVPLKSVVEIQTKETKKGTQTLVETPSLDWKEINGIIKEIRKNLRLHTLAEIRKQVEEF